MVATEGVKETDVVRETVKVWEIVGVWELEVVGEGKPVAVPRAVGTVAEGVRDCVVVAGMEADRTSGE